MWIDNLERLTKMSGSFVRQITTYAVVGLFVWMAVRGQLSGEFVTGIITLVVKSWWDSRDEQKRDEVLVRAALAQPAATTQAVSQ